MSPLGLALVLMVLAAGAPMEVGPKAGAAAAAVVGGEASSGRAVAAQEAAGHPAWSKQHDGKHHRQPLHALRRKSSTHLCLFFALAGLGSHLHPQQLLLKLEELVIQAVCHSAASLGAMCCIEAWQPAIETGKHKVYLRCESTRGPNQVQRRQSRTLRCM